MIKNKLTNKGYTQYNRLHNKYKRITTFFNNLSIFFVNFEICLYPKQIGPRKSELTKNY